MTVNISIDVDNIIHYLRARNYKPEQYSNLDSIYLNAIPRYLDVFDEYNLKATFFIIGEDALKYPKQIKMLHDAGHEIANHTQNHYQNFMHLNPAQIKSEIKEATDTLEQIIGDKVVGFRAPGWNVNTMVFETLEELGYTYDSSVYPSKLIPLLNYYNKITNKGRMPASLGENHKLGFAPKEPYYPDYSAFWKENKSNKILEIPPTVVPVVDLPFLGSSLYKFGKGLHNLSNWLVQMTRDFIIYELHAIELVDHVEVNDNRLSVKPGFMLPIESKLGLYRFMLDSFKKDEFKTLKQITKEHENSTIIK